jgi:acyl-CoA hydrolase
MRIIAAADLDLAALLRPSDRIVVGQATAEPLTLTRRLVSARGLPDGCSVFLGALYSDTFDGADGLTLEGYGAVGQGARLARAGRLDVLPWHYSRLAPAFADGTLRADCVLVQLAPAIDGDGFNLGLANDYVLDAARRARLVIAEINPDAPSCHGAEWPSDIPVHICVAAEHPPLEREDAAPGETELAIADNVASLIPDRAALQLGVGAIPQAVAGKLAGHRDLGLHSGALFDAVVDLVECGAMTNAAKEHDTGVSVGGLLLGSRRLYDFANDNRSFRLRPPARTHAQAVLGGLSRFCAINSSVEVDLTGQVNAETAGGRYLGAVGGQVDFVRGANASPGGRAIIALPSTARGGTVSRIVPRVETVTCPRSDADAVVTEWGIAELRGCTLSQRAERMIAIAAPQFRETLARQWHDAGRAACG